SRVRIGFYGRQDGLKMTRWREGELTVQPARITEALHVMNLRQRWTKRRLLQESRRRVGIGVIVGPGRRRRRRGETGRAGGQPEMAANLAGRVIDGVNVQVSFAFFNDLDLVGGR